MTITGPSRHGDVAPTPLPLDPIPLPDEETGERLRRRRERNRTRRQRWALAAGVAVVFLVTTVLVVARGDDGGDEPGAPAAPSRTGTAVSGPDPVMLSSARDDGRAAWITAVVPAANGKGGSLLLIPPGTMTEIPSLGLEPLGLALSAGGGERLLSATENLVGASLGSGVVVDDTQLTELAEAAGALTVEVPGRVELVQPSGRVTVLYEPGPNRVEPSDVPQLFAARGRGTDLIRLARHAAYWEAWLDRIRREPPATPPDSAAYRTLAAVASGTARVSVLPVQAAGTLDGEEEAYQVDKAELAKLVATVFAGRPAVASRLRVRVLNGTGELELAQKVATRLVPAGLQITHTGNANPLGQRETQIIYYDPAKRPAAEKVRQALGVGLLVHNRNQTDVVDVTVIVGKDFRTE